jgi:hypothetical protein
VQLFANCSEEEEIYPLTAKEIVAAQKADPVFDDPTRDRIRDCVRATRYHGCTIEHAT